VKFENIVDGDYYIAVRHRNHLNVITQSGVSIVSGLGAYNFKLGGALGSNPMIQLPNEQFALWGGDLNADGVIDATDRSQAWNDRNLIGYLSSDATLDGVVDAEERSLTWSNRNKTSGLPQ
jgi:hypothetical protein